MDIKNLEKTLWAASNKLRGSMDASSYKDVVLGMIFLKYISDRFENARQKCKVEEPEMYNEKETYTKDNIFWVPKRIPNFIQGCLGCETSIRASPNW